MAEEQLRDGVGQWLEDNISVPLWDFLQPDKNADQIREERDNQVRKGLQVQRELDEYNRTDTSFSGEAHKVLVGTIADAVTNVINANDYVGDWAGSMLPGRSQTDIPWSNEYQPSNLQSPVAPNNTTAGKMIRDLASLYVNMRQAGATGLGIGGGATLKSRLATEALRGGVVDFFTNGQGQENLSNTIQGTSFANPISQSLAINPEDSDLTARFKSTGEGVLLGLGVDGTQELAGPASKLAIKAGKQIKTDLSVVPEDIDRFIEAIKNSSPPPGSNLEPVLAGIPSLTESANKIIKNGAKNGTKNGVENGAKHLDELTQSNVLKMNAANPASHAHDLPPGFKGSESSKNRTAANKEIAGLRQDSDRATRAAAATDWLQSSLIRFNRKVGQSLDSTGRAIAEPHHVADHALVGDINLAIGEDRANILFKNLNAKDIRTGNDGYQMINIPGTKNLGPGSRNDHMKLIHKTWYPQIETRKILTDAIADGTIETWSNKRIADLLASTIRQQQEITIGWAKWKLNKVRNLYPDTKKLNPQEMRDWLHKHPYEFSKAGAGEAPEHFTEITKYKATKGQGNYTNKYLRAVFGLQYNPRTLGRTHAIPLSDRQRVIQEQKRTQIEHYTTKPSN